MAATTADGDPIADELARKLNSRQSKKIRRHPRSDTSRAAVFADPDSVVVVYASGVPGATLWGVWTRQRTYCDDREMDVGTLGSLFQHRQATVVDFEDVPASIQSVFGRRCRQ